MKHDTATGYYQIDNRFLREPWARQVEPYGIAVYNVLACFAGDDSSEVRLSFQTIASLAGYSRRTVINKIASSDRDRALAMACHLERSEGSGDRAGKRPPVFDRRGFKTAAAPPADIQPPASTSRRLNLPFRSDHGEPPVTLVAPRSIGPRAGPAPAHKH